MSHSPVPDVFEDQDQDLSHKAKRRRQRKAAKRASDSHRPPRLDARSASQSTLLEHLQEGRSSFAVGPAGTGKTYLAARVAAQRLEAGHIDKIVLSRVTVSRKRHEQGFLPGKLEQKMAPWLVPVMEALKAELGGKLVEKMRLDGRIEVVSFEHMRGRTFDRCFVILDEAQNADFADLRLFLTRVGEESQVVCTGDLDQVDIPDSGLFEVIEIAIEDDVPMEVVIFKHDEVVRSEFASAWVKAFKSRDQRTGRDHTQELIDRVSTEAVQMPEFLTGEAV